MKFSKCSYNKRVCHEKMKNKFLIIGKINENKTNTKKLRYKINKNAIIYNN